MANTHNLWKKTTFSQRCAGHLKSNDCCWAFTLPVQQAEHTHTHADTQADSFEPVFHFSPKKINPRFAQYIKCTACERKEERTCCESGWSSDEHLLCPPFILLLAPPLLSLLWAVIDLIPSSLNWSHDSCCSDWPSLTTHRHSSVMLSPIYLSICLCLLSLSLPSGESTCWPYRAGTAWLVPTCIWSVLLWFWLLLSKNKYYQSSYYSYFFRSLMQVRGPSRFMCKEVMWEQSFKNIIYLTMISEVFYVIVFLF